MSPYPQIEPRLGAKATFSVVWLGMEGFAAFPNEHASGKGCHYHDILCIYVCMYVCIYVGR